jgi:ribosome-associated protein
MEEITFSVRGEYITLGQLLKVLDLVPTGGQAKMVIQSGDVKVNGEVETRRGRKLRPGDIVEIWNYRIKLVGEGEV